MARAIVPRHFILSVFLLLALLAAYIFSEARRLQQELLRQTEAKGAALADAMESSLRSSILGNSLLEELIAQRLIDNARLIDHLLRFPPVDQDFINHVAAANGLRKVELLDSKGRPWGPILPAQQRREQMMAQMRDPQAHDGFEQRRGMKPFMWGRRWPLPQSRREPQSKITERKFWEGSVFGVAVGATSFPGILAVHADADYILNFREEIDVQRQIEDLGRQSDITHAAFIDRNRKILAHTDRRLIDQTESDHFGEGDATGSGAGGIVHRDDGSRYYRAVREIDVSGAPIGSLEIAFSLAPMDAAWRHSLKSMLVVGGTILVIGILGMATISYLQHNHLRKVATLENEISRRQRLSELGNMAATVAHEIRNPLNSVSMGLQRLRNEFAPIADAADYERFLDLMQREVRRLNGAVEQFLSLARPLTLKPEKFTVVELLDDLSTLVGGEAAGANVRLEQQVTPDLPAVEADRDQLKQVLLNLMLNGIQAMPRGGAVTVSAQPNKELLELTVSDNGTGMTEETARRIFEPYFTTKVSGSGLGLAIARRIVEAHGGKITVDSAPGRGTSFKVHLPFVFRGA